jgi:nucleoside-diphosphate-sugar epimerase
MTRPRVVLTGAAGTIASLLLPALRERYDLLPLDIRATNRAGEPIPGLAIADLTDPDRNAYRAHFAGADAIIHLGFVSSLGDPDPEACFRAELSNVAMAYNVYRTAWEEGVRRVVMASSNHAADYYERLILAKEWDSVSPEDRPLSDNYYGWAKATYEHLGFTFAVGRENGRPLENIQIRIGGPRETDLAQIAPGDLTRMRRALAVYISQRDLAQLFIKSIETEDIRDPHGVPCQVFYGISDNPHAFWSIVNARKVIGYAPQDNSELRFADQIAQHIAVYRKQHGEA